MKLNRKTRKIFAGIAATALLSGAIVTGGFQGVLAALGFLSLAAITGFMVMAMKKGRLYSSAVRYANSVNDAGPGNPGYNRQVEDISETDAKWIAGHINEFFVAKRQDSDMDGTVTSREKKEIMKRLPELFAGSPDGNLTSVDKEEILANVRMLFEPDAEYDDRQLI